MIGTAPPQISVIITCFNQQDWIGDAIESVRTQSFVNWECLVVDDGSTDETAQVVRQLCAADSRVRLIRQANTGVSGARNTGFVASTGEFIQFLDGDDWIRPRKFELQLLHFQRDPDIAVSCCGFSYQHLRSPDFNRYPVQPIQRAPLQQLLFQWFDGSCLPLHAALFRRSIWPVNVLPFRPDYTGRCEDWIFLVDVALHGALFGNIDDELCVYRTGCAGFTSSAKAWNVASLMAAVQIAHSVAPELKNKFLEHYFARTLDRYLELQRPEILQDSGNWRLGNRLTKPIFSLLRMFGLSQR